MISEYEEGLARNENRIVCLIMPTLLPRLRRPNPLRKKENYLVFQRSTEMNSEFDTVTITLMAIIVAFFAIVLLVVLIKKISNFSDELNYTNIEIGRTEGAEREYWKRKKRRLWLSLLPFYRK